MNLAQYLIIEQKRLKFFQQATLAKQLCMGAQIESSKEGTLQLNKPRFAPPFIDDNKSLLRKHLIRKENFNSKAEFFIAICCNHFAFDHDEKGRCLVSVCQNCKGLKIKQPIAFTRIDITTLNSNFWNLVEKEVKSWKDKG